MTVIDAPPPISTDSVVQERSETDTENDLRKQEEFYEHVANLCDPSKEEELDQCDYQFLTDFAICSLTYTVYNELNLGTFFTKTDDDQAMSDEEEQIRSFDTKNRFRISQIYPIIVRCVLGYYAHTAHSYYKATINTRRNAQVPIGLNDKAYAIVCNSIRRLILEIIKREGVQKAVVEPESESEPESEKGEKDTGKKEEGDVSV